MNPPVPENSPMKESTSALVMSTWIVMGAVNVIS